MEKRPPNPRAARDEVAQNEARYQPPRGRQPYGQRQPPVYRREPEPPDPLEEVLGEIATLQHAITKLSNDLPAKEEVLGLVREVEAKFGSQLANYYPKDVMDDKLAERSQIWQALQGQLDETRQKIDAPRQDGQTFTHTFLRAFFNTWQSWAVVVSCLILATIFSVVVLIDIAVALLRK